MLTAILTVWKRNNLEKQIQAVQSSSIKPSRIIVFQNESHVDVSPLIAKYKVEHVHAVSTNFKYHARFAMCLGIESEFFAIYDDDTVPGEKWHEVGIEASEKLNAITGSNGRSYLSSYRQQIPSGGVSNGQFSTQVTPSDIVGHAWLIKKEHICNMFSYPVSDFSTGEDIHLSLVNKTYFGVDTVVPPQPELHPEMWGDREPALGLDEFASFKTNVNHNTSRHKLFEEWRSRGWKPYYSGELPEGGEKIAVTFQGWASR